MVIPNIIKNNKKRLELWNQYLPVMFKNGVIDQIDVPAFQSFIILLSHFEESQEYIDEHGLFYESVDREGKVLLKVNPAHKTLADSQRMLVSCYMRYGMSDYDRKSNQKKFIADDNDDNSDFGDFE